MGELRQFMQKVQARCRDVAQKTEEVSSEGMAENEVEYALESYCPGMSDALQEETLNDTFEVGGKEKIETAVLEGT